MTYRNFCRLHSKIRQDIEDETKKGRAADSTGSNPKNAPPVPNGTISTSVRLAVAIRYFAGGLPHDLSNLYGISHSSILESIWVVVEAINNHKEFHIVYPESHDEQQKIAQGFRDMSSSGFNICAGAVGGILIWMHKPRANDCVKLGLDQTKFWCDRLKKFGLNCQAVCDANGRFLEISICMRGASSNCFAFEHSTLYKRMEDGILAEDLCLFGDNAYLNTS
jgi:hypothetical protein